MKFKMWLESEETMEVPEGYRGIMYVMKGVPASGKSHLALRLAEGDSNKVFSADTCLERMPGGYRANWPTNLSKAHRICENSCRRAMQLGTTPVVVDNTNLRMVHVRPYIAMATQYQYYPIIKESDSPWWGEISTLLKDKKQNKDQLDAWADKLANGFDWEGKTIKNSHGVPKETIQDMFKLIYPYSVDDIKKHI